MKKIIAFLLCCLFLCGCTTTTVQIEQEEIIDTAAPSFKGVWLSYYELDSLIDNASEDDFKRNVDLMLGKVSALGLNTVIVHARANGDAYYESNVFPKAVSLQNANYDPLKIVVELADKYSIQVHAWVNPYRISGSKSIEQLPIGNIASKILSDEDLNNDSSIIGLENGVYFDPASSYAQQLILSGVAEIVQNYNVDAIHIDDYFYPITDAGFDKASYESYVKATATPLNLADFRRQNVNNLVKSIYKTVKNSNSKVEFGISPMYNINANFEDFYADVQLWLKNDGYADYICPQLYFGYKHNTADFTKILNEWNSLEKHKSIKLYAGLAPYKIGTNDELSNNEWNTDTDILKRQVADVHNANNFDGYCFYSYTSLFSNDVLNTKQRENLLSVIK